MKAEINNENKAKFFALYWGQEVAKNGDESYFLESCPEMAEWIHSNFHLELKPLSQISDDDAIELGYQKCNDELNVNYGMSASGCFLDENGHMDEFLMSDADYLRSKGYALPWMGLSVDKMINAGWIKLTNQ